MTANSSVAAIFQPSSAPMVLEEVEVKPADADSDFEDSRRNLIQIMAATKAAIGSLSALAQASQDPDVFDKLNKFIETYNRQQEQLIRIHRLKALNKQDQTQSPAAVSGDLVDNRTQNVFVGTPADLARVLEGMKASKSEIT